MSVGQAQHCVICGSPGIIMVKDQTLCAPCATPTPNEGGFGGYLQVVDCPECSSEDSFILRESGYNVCDECWHDELDPVYGEELML